LAPTIPSGKVFFLVFGFWFFPNFGVSEIWRIGKIGKLVDFFTLFKEFQNNVCYFVCNPFVPPKKKKKEKKRKRVANWM
jgi:hypothetical protein